MNATPSDSTPSDDAPGPGFDEPQIPGAGDTEPATPASSHGAEARLRGAAGHQLDNAAAAVHQMGERARLKGGLAARAEPVAHIVAGKFEDAAGYVRGTDVGTMRADIEGEVRSAPLRSVGIAAVAGFLLGKVLR